MISIETVDPNFRVPENAFSRNLHFYDPQESPFRIFGVTHCGGCYRRMPREIAAAVSEGVLQLHTHTAGGRIRFRTNSRCVAIVAQMSNLSKMPHFAFTGSIGFDLYEKVDGNQIFQGAAIPTIDISDRLEGLWDLGTEDMHELTLHLPLYSGVDSLYIGLDKTARLEAPAEYTYPRPVVYYGSSITQGGCASRPGNAYPNQISLALDCDHINLGFSGNAKAEDSMAQYLSSLDMSVFVYDYDHNAPNTDYLAATHEKLFLTLRKVHPQLPVIMLSMPRSKPCDRGLLEQRQAIIRQTYENALRKGDRNVYYIPGPDLLGEWAEAATVDNCHPTDLGFWAMARKLLPVLKPLLQ